MKTKRHRGPVTSVAMRPGTSEIVSGAYDSGVGVFDTQSNEFCMLGYHDHLTNRVVVSPDGRLAASCSSDYSVRLWDLETRSLIKVLRGHSDDAEDFVFVGPHVGVSASRDRRILVWDLRTGAIAFVFDDHDKDVLSLAYHQGRLFSSGDDKTLRVWNLAEGTLERTIGPFEVETDTCDIDPVRGRVVLGCDDGVVRVFDVRDGEVITAIEGHTSGIKKVAVSEQGHILSAAYDQKIVIWDRETFQPRKVLESVKHKWERSFAFADGGTSVIAGTFDGTLLKWDAGSGALTGEFGGDGAGNACFNRVATSRGGRMVLVSDDGLIRMGVAHGDAARIQKSTSSDAPRMLMNAVALNDGGDRVWAGAHDQKLHMYRFDGDALDEEGAINLAEGPINFVSIAQGHGCEGHAFVGCYSGSVVQVDPKGDVVRKFRAHDGAVKSVRLHPTQPLGVSCSAEGDVRAWSLGGEIVRTFPGHLAIVNDLDLDPEGQRLATVGRDFCLRIFDVESGEVLWCERLGFRSLKSVCFASMDRVVSGTTGAGSSSRI